MKSAIAILDRGVARSIDAIGTTATASAVQAHVRVGAEVQLDYAGGAAQFDPPRTFDAETPMDLASLTKVFTATLVMQAVDEGRCDLASPIAQWVPGWFDGPRPVRVLDLLNHASGLPAWDQFYLRMPIQPDTATAAQTADEIERQIVAKQRLRPGAQAAYSDLGYILLGRIVERLFDDRLEDLVADRVAGPLDLRSIRYVSMRRDDSPISTAAATELDPRRGGVVVGRVHDENCHIQGGVAGHAGLFGVARDVAAFAQHLLDIDGGATGIVRHETLQACWSEDARGADGSFLGGWDTPSGPTSTAGRGFPRAATVGHLGFTGTSLWIDRSARLVAVLLTNRVYPTRENDRIKGFRIAFHEAIHPPR